jgi:hypothetical protein
VLDRPRIDADEAEAAIVAVGAEFLGESNGWWWGRQPWESDLDSVTSALAHDRRAVALGGWVADSDCAYLVFATPDGEVGARVAINQTLPFGETLEEVTDLWGDHVARGAAFEDLARWASKHAPRTIEAASLLREMPGWPDAVAPQEGLFFADDDPWYDEDGEAGGGRCPADLLPARPARH